MSALSMSPFGTPRILLTNSTRKGLALASIITAPYSAANARQPGARMAETTYRPGR